MGVARIELATSALSVLRSNRLSYTPGWAYLRVPPSNPYLPDHESDSVPVRRRHVGALQECPGRDGLLRLARTLSGPRRATSPPSSSPAARSSGTELRLRRRLKSQRCRTAETSEAGPQSGLDFEFLAGGRRTEGRVSRV